MQHIDPPLHGYTRDWERELGHHYLAVFVSHTLYFMNLFLLSITLINVNIILLCISQY